MTLIPREEQFKNLFPDAPAFRRKQMAAALFDEKVNGWNDVSTLPKAMRDVLEKNVPWMTCEQTMMMESSRKDTFKALLKAADAHRFESVLMANKRGQWTICVSSQIGCAMKCVFCATGTMGLKRSLLADEIADQYRFWKKFLRLHPEFTQRISNVVFMGMGEPLANYQSVKGAINTWLAYTDIGPTRITVSSVGMLAFLDKLLTDPEWPHVRIAISLHSANQERRKEIVPTTVPDFLIKLADWSHRYAGMLGNRRHHITYEYTVLSGVNDTDEIAHELARYIQKTASSKINIIPYNPVPGKPFERSQHARIAAFKAILLSYGLNVTQRKTMGDDIAAACGQLVTEKNLES